MNLKSIIFLLACGVACLHAQSDCSGKGIHVCNNIRKFRTRVPKTDVDMEEFCTLEQVALQCIIDSTKGCPNLISIFEDHTESLKNTKILCDKNKPYRKVALDNAACFAENVKKVDYACLWPEVAKSEGETCNRLKKMLKCQEEKMVEGCGEIIRDIYKLVQHPEYELRKKQCS